ncbi:3-hydroxyacyl-CoA dehydrogenase NAD-binding domain-containing protein [uncultured Shimia sp.]|uniref:3-hydroxyacyl-CoA dehydrogenase NAD-binding domain-containing protein n=1 Tax=uncultured Shimia sp. TaxID=573152 RepID=UPI00262204E3|nr:3-hydroxyacyl-CoA dehydrogenase NAD-binding domain-containing protein [uncultured Shimia sp.]
MAGSVSYSVEDGVAILMLDNPPANTLSPEVRRGVFDALTRAVEDPVVQAIVLMGAGRTFSAGADLAEFDGPQQAPQLTDVCDKIEAASKPVIAALHGSAMSGGFEMALAAHLRVASPAARFGFPETTLGLVPSAGGTQRAPRLAGAEHSLDLMLSGQPMRANDPRAEVFIDHLLHGNLRQQAICFAKEHVAEAHRLVPTRQSVAGFADPMAYQREVARRRAEFAETLERAPQEIVSCVEAAALLPFEQGLAFEQAAFETLVTSDQSAALRHAHFAERRATKFPGLGDVNPRGVTSVGIVGGGDMGRGLALACLKVGLPVVLVERNGPALSEAMSKIDATFAQSVAREEISARLRDRQRAALKGADDFVALAEVDLVVEAVPEDMQTKLAVFAQLDGVIKEKAILATSTSYLDVNRMARETGSPQDVLGLHFLAPANKERLVEVAVGEETAPEVVATAVSLARRLGKIPVRTGVGGGFIGNRIQAAYRLAADMMLEEGATPYLIDEAMQDWGMAMGPYRALDAEGLAPSWEQRKRQAETRDPAARYVAIGDRLCEAGRLGRASGRGYYLYSETAPDGVQDPDVVALIRAERESKGFSARGFKPEEIQRRCLAAMANEGARLLRAEMADRPSDIDAVMVHGFGFPRWRGGPMMAADLVGLLPLRRDLDSFTPDAPEFWTADPIFSEFIKNGQGFASLNA